MHFDNGKMILLNDSYKSHPKLKFIVAHELLHALIHDGTHEFYHFTEYAKSYKEREADEFATKLLAYAYDFRIQEGITKYEVMLERGIPHEMQDYLTPNYFNSCQQTAII